MNYIILDLEATCHEDKPDYFRNEIIEIGAVKLNKNKEITDKFQSFVRPIVNPVLTEFCINLTTITQNEVDTANTFDIVSKQFIKWIGDDYILCSWGMYDKNQFKKDCELHNIPNSWVEPHINLKEKYQTLVRQAKKGVGMAKALQQSNIPLEGTHHRGIDDAINMTKIFIKYSNKWDF